MTFNRGYMPGFANLAGFPDYSSHGTIIYENRNASGLATPFDTGVAMVASGTIAAVAEWTSVASASQYAAGSGAAGTTPAGVSALNLTTGAFRGRAADGTSVVQPNTSSSLIVDATPVVVLMSWTNGGNIVVRCKTSQVSSSIAALGSLGTANFQAGKTNGSGVTLTGVLYHLLIFSTVVADLAALQSDLNSDWGTS